MSRIHEALKKAEREKAANLPAAERSTPALAPVAEDDLPVFTSKRLVAEPVQDSRITEGGVILRFEELVQRCTHPEWKADSALRIS